MYCRKQFGFLDQMQGEIDAAGPPTPVRILGVNPAGYASGNAAMCQGRVLPWLQDTAQQDVWGSWQVTWRDVVASTPRTG